MLYIAYGSNIDPQEISLRCPSAKFVDVGMLNNYKLVMRRYLDVDCCNGELMSDHITPCGVPIVAYEIDDKDIPNLDRYEAYPDLYTKIEVNVTLKNDNMVDNTKGIIYIMTDEQKKLTPYEKCDDLYLKRVARGYDVYQFNHEFLKEAYNNYK